jgi:rSAM/selenodomain-associated transferase 1
MISGMTDSEHSPNRLTQAVLGLVAKQPEPGQVKTRLAHATNATWASQVAEAFLLDGLDRWRSFPARRVVVFAPAKAVGYFQRTARENFDLIPQSEGDLGQRMASFIAGQLQAGVSKVVLIGTDSPTLPVAYVHQAFQELQNAEVVLGPATDGGYYLLGCSCFVPELFERVPWSTSRVLHTTVARVRQERLRLALLPPWYDVDTLDDWRMLQGHVAALRGAGQDPGLPRTERLLECS